MKKFLTCFLCMLLGASITLAGTLAYFSHMDSDINVMTIGDVNIIQHEYERVLNDDGTYEMYVSQKYGEGYKLQKFTQSKPLYPATGKITGYGMKVPFDQIPGASGSHAVLDGLNNVQDKFVLVENAGVSDVYVRTLIALEYGSDKNDLIGINIGDFWTWNELGVVNMDNNKYYVYEALYKGSDTRHLNGVLPVGEFTYSSLNQIYLANEATNADAKALDGNKNGTYDILVLSQAVQTEGFKDAREALDTAFGEFNETNVKDWFKNTSGSNGNVGTNPAPEGAIQVEGSDRTAVLAAIKEANDGDVIALTQDTTIAGTSADKKLILDKAIVLDLNGKTLTTESGWGGIDMKNGASIVNGTINHKGNTAAIKAFQVGKIENVVINLTQTAGKVKGGIVVQEGAGCYIGSIKNVVINGATNGIETYRCGERDDLAIGSMENVTIIATDTGISLSAPIGTLKNCTIKGEKVGINAYLYGPYSVKANLVNCVVSGETGIYAHDEAGKTNPGSMELIYDAKTSLSISVVRDFEIEVKDRVFVGVK